MSSEGVVDRRKDHANLKIYNTLPVLFMDSTIIIELKVTICSQSSISTGTGFNHENVDFYKKIGTECVT
jgi:hypothetical protein